MNYIKKCVLFLASVSTISFGMMAMAPSQAIAAPVSPVFAQQVCAQTGDACDNFVKKYINPFILLLTILIGVFGAISIVVAGIQYASSADDPGAVTKAKTRIFNTVLGLLAYFFLFAFLQWLIPGGAL